MGVSRGWMVQLISNIQASSFDAVGLGKRGNWEVSGCVGHDKAHLEQFLWIDR